LNILILGQHGSGKSTQAHLLGHFFRLPVISTGEIFRELAHSGTKAGKTIRDRLEAGDYIEDTEVIPVVEDRLSKPDVQRGFIMEGYPRSLKQAEALVPVFDFVFHLTLDDAIGIKRQLERERPDDTLEVITRRISEHHLKADAIISYYQSVGTVIAVDASRHIEEVHRDLLRRIRSVHK
jgi:adenylate kinase